MTNGLSVFLGVIIMGALAYDAFANDWQGFMFMMRRFVDLTEYLAFWR